MRRPPYELTQRTLSLIERFQNVAWFAHVGEPVADPSIVVARDIREVKHRFFTRAWENVRIDVQNQLSGYLCDHHPPRYHKGWNEIAETAGKLLDLSIARLVEAGSVKLKLGALSTRAFEANIRRDIIAACHESEYADVHPPSLNTQMASWYLAGHFPCGYEGQWPSGKLVVF